MGDEADAADDYDDYLHDGFLLSTIRYIPSKTESIKKQSYKNFIKNKNKPEQLNNTPMYNIDKYGSYEERLQFCLERDKLHKEREINFNKDRIEALKTMTPSQMFVKCKRCKGGFIVRKVDVQRGWGKFCSKSCKAQHHNSKNFGTLK